MDSVTRMRFPSTVAEGSERLVIMIFKQISCDLFSGDFKADDASWLTRPLLFWDKNET